MKKSMAGLAFSFVSSFATAALAGPIPLNLGTAENFAVLAGATVTNTGSSRVSGNLGVWPGSSITGFPPGIVVNGATHIGDSVAMNAQNDALNAYTVAAAETGGASLTGEDLGGQNLTAGIYSFSSSAQLTGTLTLNAQGAQDAVFIFQIGSTLTTAANALISVVNGRAAEIIWQVGSSATLGSGTNFDGDIIALTSVTLESGASISCGAALALNGAVTLDSNEVSTTGASCGGDESPVPEPASVLSLAAACSIFLATRWRRTKKRLI